MFVSSGSYAGSFTSIYVSASSDSLVTVVKNVVSVAASTIIIVTV